MFGEFLTIIITNSWFNTHNNSNNYKSNIDLFNLLQSLYIFYMFYSIRLQVGIMLDIEAEENSTKSHSPKNLEVSFCYLRFSKDSFDFLMTI